MSRRILSLSLMTQTQWGEICQPLGLPTCGHRLCAAYNGRFLCARGLEAKSFRSECRFFCTLQRSLFFLLCQLLAAPGFLGLWPRPQAKSLPSLPLSLPCSLLSPPQPVPLCLTHLCGDAIPQRPTESGSAVILTLLWLECELYPHRLLGFHTWPPS